MTKKTVTVFAATGTAGRACVEEMIRLGTVNVRVLARKSGQAEKITSGVARDADDKQRLQAGWRDSGVAITEVDATNHTELMSVLQGTDYLVSCVPTGGTEAQYPLIWAAKEACVERFVLSECGAICEFEQFCPTDTVHRTWARQKAFIRRVIELAGLDVTIIPAGLWPEYYMLEPVRVMGDLDRKVSWSTGRDVGRIIPHVLSHPLSRNAICPVSATAYCSWDELLAIRESALGRKVARNDLTSEQWKAIYAQQPPGRLKCSAAIGVACSEGAEGMSLFANWNGTFLPEFSGTLLPQLFIETIEPFVSARRNALVASGELPAT